jgi:hypothetical protein
MTQLQTFRTGSNAVILSTLPHYAQKETQHAKKNQLIYNSFKQNGKNLTLRNEQYAPKYLGKIW